jgi:single-strand DNA-binding protein
MENAMNDVKLCGNLGSSPELRTTGEGTPVCNFNMATDSYFVDGNGNKQKRTEWHRIVIWGKAAEACAKNLSKGRMVLVSGSLRTRKWEDKEGGTRTTTEIHSTNVKFLGGAPRKQDEPAAAVDDGGQSGVSEEPFEG